MRKSNAALRSTLRRTRRALRGFTLLELLVVTAIIITVAALSASAFWAMTHDSQSGKTRLLLQQLAASVKALKASYRCSGPIGVDRTGKPLPKARLDDLDLGWELDPRNRLWGPGGVPQSELVLNKRRQTFFNTTESQVLKSPAPHLVDYFGRRIRYALDEPGGVLVERILSLGEDGTEGTPDDIEILLDRYAVR